MKILFINSNRYQHPPVIPIAIEYLAGALSKTNHSYAILDLCFADDPIAEIRNSINIHNPDVIGITIRQVDTVLYQNNEFFLPEIKEYITICKENDRIVILGGVGFSIMPEKILDYTDANYGIEGPGELALIDVLNKLENNEDIQRVVNGYSYFNKPNFKFDRELLFNYKKYIENDGIVGFRTQIGCNEKCIFCTEGNKNIIYHKPESVAKEIMDFKNKGFTKFHLCDSEFNINLKHCISICKAIYKYAGLTDWVLYMKLEPFSDELFYWLKKSGADLITLSLNTKDVNYKKLEEFCHLASLNNIKIAVDLSTGFPNEDINSLLKMIDALDPLNVSTVGVNSFYRIYPGTPLFEQIEKNGSMNKYLINWKPGVDYISPVFYNYFNEEMLKKAIGNKKKFRIEGFEKATNYQRV